MVFFFFSSPHTVCLRCPCSDPAALAPLPSVFRSLGFPKLLLLHLFQPGSPQPRWLQRQELPGPAAAGVTQLHYGGFEQRARRRCRWLLGDAVAPPTWPQPRGVRSSPPERPRSAEGSGGGETKCWCVPVGTGHPAAAFPAPPHRHPVPPPWPGRPSACPWVTAVLAAGVGSTPPSTTGHQDAERVLQDRPMGTIALRPPLRSLSACVPAESVFPLFQQSLFHTRCQSRPTCSRTRQYI